MNDKEAKDVKKGDDDEVEDGLTATAVTQLTATGVDDEVATDGEEDTTVVCKRRMDL